MTDDENERVGVATGVSVGIPVSDRVSWREREAVALKEFDSEAVAGAVSVSGGVTVDVTRSVCVREREGVSLTVCVSVGTRDRDAEVDMLVVTVWDDVPVPDKVKVREAVSSKVFEPVSIKERDSLFDRVVVSVSDALALTEALRVCVVVAVADVDNVWEAEAEAELVKVAVKVCVAVGLGRGIMKKMVWQLPTGTRCTYSSMGTLCKFGILTKEGLRRSSATVSALHRRGINVTSEARSWPAHLGIVCPALQSDTMVKSVPVTEAPLLQPA